jgi:hypothetical protein
VPAKKVGAFTRVGMGLDASEFGLGWIEHDGIDAEVGKKGEEIGPSFSDQLVGKEVSVADDDTKNGAGSRHGSERERSRGERRRMHQGVEGSIIAREFLPRFWVFLGEL